MEQPNNTAYIAITRMRADACAISLDALNEFDAYRQSIQQQSVVEKASKLRLLMINTIGRVISEERKILRRMYMDKCLEDKKYMVDISKKFDKLNKLLVGNTRIEARISQRRFWDKVLGDIARERKVVLKSPQFTADYPQPDLPE